MKIGGNFSNSAALFYTQESLTSRYVSSQEAQYIQMQFGTVLFVARDTIYNR